MVILLLSLSLVFTACSDGGDDNSISNPSPTLPENQGDNPVDEVLGEGTTTSSIILNKDDYYTLELKRDGTAIQYNQYNEEIPDYEFSYTYNTNENKIYMKIERFYISDEKKWYTFDDTIARINEYYTVDYMRKDIEEYFNEIRNETWFKQEYPNCTTYKEFEKFSLEKSGFVTLDEMVKNSKAEIIEYYKIEFGVLITYGYKTSNGKMTLTEKFTGLKNVHSDLEYENNDIRICLSNNLASLRIYAMGDKGYYYSGTFKNDTIVFFNEINRDDKITATYTENIKTETVTVTIKDGDYTGTYICEFEGATYTQK